MPAHDPERISIRELGDNQSVQRWTRYRDVLPANEYQENFLLKMLTDSSIQQVEEGALVWVPFHAWRALAEMRSLAVIDPVLELAERDAYQQSYNDFAKLAGAIGEPAVDPLMAILADRGRPETSRTLAAEGLGEIGRSLSGQRRASIVDALMNQIRKNPSDGWINGMATAALIAMEERSVASEILTMFEEGRIQGVVRAEDITNFFGAQS